MVNNIFQNIAIFVIVAITFTIFIYFLIRWCLLPSGEQILLSRITKLFIHNKDRFVVFFQKINFPSIITYIIYFLVVIDFLCIFEIGMIIFCPLYALINDFNLFFMFSLYLLPFSIFTFVIFPIFCCNSKKRLLESMKNPNRLIDERNDHHAIAVAISTTVSKRMCLCVGTSPLIKKFSENEIPFQVYLCTQQNVNSVISKEKAKYLYLFGHGFQGGLTFHLYEGMSQINYCDQPEIPRKKFIAQLHCNRGSDQSLCDKKLLNRNQSNCFILKGIIQGLNYGPDVWLNVRFNLLKKIQHIWEKE